jgi:hypothetical protein
VACLGAGAGAQDKPAKAKASGKGAKEQPAKKVEPLPKGEVKVLKAIVIEVEGAAQARDKPDAKWKKLKVNDVLAPGALIRTGRKSHVALRVGMNATVLVERQTRVAIPEIVQDGDTLRTRVSMEFGKADVKVDRIGLRNDFGVATPTATLAVRGTVFRITWDAVVGFKAVGVVGNRIVAIEVKYLNKVLAYLSGADSTSGDYNLPALDGFYSTYVVPLIGSIGKSESDITNFVDPSFLDNIKKSTQLSAAQKARGSKIPDGGSTDNPTGQ